MVESVKRLHLPKISLYIFFGLLAYMPFHIFLSTWIGASLGVLEAAKAAKDVVLVVGFLAVLGASLGQPWLRILLKEKLVWLIVAYSAWTALLAILKPIDQDAEVLGVVYNTRFLLFFLYGLLLTKFFKAEWLATKALKIVLAVATIVLFFGIVQYAVLPDDALARVGYSRENGVLPAFFIDDKPDLERVMSTLRDPNSFGSYVVIVLSLALVFLLKVWQKNLRQIFLGIATLAVLCLILTFSRSAWLGAVAAVVTVIAMSSSARTLISKHAKTLAISLATLLFVATVVGFIFRESYFVQNVVLHADESTVLENPQELRSRFFRESVDGITAEPLGHGPGTAGLTSIQNDVQGTVLNENYYLQIAYEVGLPGLVLFLTILTVVATRLWRTKTALSAGLLAAFAGLALANFFLHIWSNEAVAYTWWGFAGLAIYSQKQKSIIKT